MKKTKIDSLTKILLNGGILAGPLYLSVSLIQAFTRPGFDILRHDVSLLSNGELGWIQISNFLVTGLLTILAALGMGRALTKGRGKTWGPLLVGLYGVGLIAAGIFVADPMNGFPLGTPEGMPKTLSSHGLGHMMAGALGFLCLIIACFIFARRFAAQKKRGWQTFSIITGIVFLASFMGIASGSSQSWIILGFWAGVTLSWSWILAVSTGLKKGKIE